MERSTNLFHGTLHKLKNPINTIYIFKKKTDRCNNQCKTGTLLPSIRKKRFLFEMF